mmetsp:Transcript_43451/g.51130  ORF Transcript_43451/g.51130 Transcript_43451/m.51130 type:complete len:241 (-) Transcript_43451:960-1682(-)
MIPTLCGNFSTSLIELYCSSGTLLSPSLTHMMMNSFFFQLVLSLAMPFELLRLRSTSKSKWSSSKSESSNFSLYLFVETNRVLSNWLHSHDLCFSIFGSGTSKSFLDRSRSSLSMISKFLAKGSSNGLSHCQFTWAFSLQMVSLIPMLLKEITSSRFKGWKVAFRSWRMTDAEFAPYHSPGFFLYLEYPCSTKFWMLKGADLSFKLSRNNLMISLLQSVMSPLNLRLELSYLLLTPSSLK